MAACNQSLLGWLKAWGFQGSPFARGKEQSNGIILALSDLAQTLHGPAAHGTLQFDSYVYGIMVGMFEPGNQRVEVAHEQGTRGHEHVEVGQQLGMHVVSGISQPVLHVSQVGLEGGGLGDKVDGDGIAALPAVVDEAQAVDALSQAVAVGANGGDEGVEGLLVQRRVCHGARRRLEGSERSRQAAEQRREGGAAVAVGVVGSMLRMGRMGCG